MKDVCKYIAAFLLLLTTYSVVNAQVSIKAGVDRNKILIGEPVLLSVEAYVPLGAQVSWFPSDSIPHFDILSRSPLDTAEGMDGKKITQLITITSFDSGPQIIPPFQVTVGGQTYLSDSISVDVNYQPFDANQDYRDIKDIVDVTNPYVQYVPWIIGLIALLSFVGMIILLRKKKGGVNHVHTPVSQSSAYEDAMEALSELRKKGIVEGEKAYYSAMNDILRKYVSRKFKVSAFERTNEELILKLSSMGIPKDPFIRLTQALRMSDFVKFAKYRPDEEDNTNNFEIVRSSIDILNSNAVSAL